MGRLTECKDRYCFTACAGEREKIREDCSFYEICYERQLYDKLAHYEDLEEQGRLIEVVKCKDCTRCWKDTIYNRLICEGHIVQPNDYCSYAKLKELEE